MLLATIILFFLASMLLQALLPIGCTNVLGMGLFKKKGTGEGFFKRIADSKLGGFIKKASGVVKSALAHIPQVSAIIGGLKGVKENFGGGGGEDGRTQEEEQNGTQNSPNSDRLGLFVPLTMWEKIQKFFKKSPKLAWGIVIGTVVAIGSLIWWLVSRKKKKNRF